MVRHIGGVGPFVPYWDLVPATTPTPLYRKAKQTGVEFLVGFETEFIRLKSTNPVEAANYPAWTASNGLPSEAESRVIREKAESLLKSGIDVTMYHPEAAPGQYEVVTGPLLPFADAFIHTRETIVNATINMVSEQPLLHASHSADDGSSSLSSRESSFLPHTNASPMVLTTAASPKSRNFELRFLDRTCNPYLALALILSAGLDGIVKDCPVPLTAAQVDEKERHEHGINKRVSLS
ncbi:hypothetical protein DFS33DRAFT_1436110 [Desarmillaria ectypa]|nr:hypothetical protein DFS33DRAFT_1436110 [Desarmillaria ectypa]